MCVCIYVSVHVHSTYMLGNITRSSLNFYEDNKKDSSILKAFVIAKFIICQLQRFNTFTVVNSLLQSFHGIDIGYS